MAETKEKQPEKEKEKNPEEESEYEEVREFEKRYQEALSQARDLKYGIEKYSGPSVPMFRILPEVEKLKVEATAHLSEGRLHEATTQYRSAASLLETAFGKAPNKVSLCFHSPPPNFRPLSHCPRRRTGKKRGCARSSLHCT